MATRKRSPKRRPRPPASPPSDEARETPSDASESRATEGAPRPSPGPEQESLPTAGGAAPPPGADAAGTPALPETPPAAPLAPRTKETFDELAKRVARAEPRRGSVVQPPPSWQPDEVTLGFAMVTDKSGATRELPEPTLLATILIAVETDRRAILNRFAGGFDEEIDAIAHLFWPFLVVHGPKGSEAAIFDGTGVWKRTFRYTLLPPVDGVRPLLDRTLPPTQYLAQMRALLPYFARDPGAEVLTVEGFLPLDPPLLFDVLSQSQFRTDPQSAHAGFLPARHKVDWYEEVVRQMRQWLERFEVDLQTLGEIRAQVETILAETRTLLEGEYRRKQEESSAQVQAALAQAEEEIGRLHATHHAEVQRYLEEIRKAQSTVARSETAIETADTLAFRASHRRADPAPHETRGKQARVEIRNANRQIAESRRKIEQIHAVQRADQEGAIGRVVQLEKANAQALAQLELFRDEYIAAGADFLQSIDGQVAARSTQKNLLAGYFLPLPSLETVSVVWFPLWVATLRGSRGIRQLVFPPMQVRTGLGFGGALKRFFGGIVLPLEARTAQFDKVLRPTMEAALAHDPWLSSATQELARAADVLVDPDVLDRLRTGLGELAREGWITRKQEEDFLEAYTERARRHAGGGPAPPGAVPSGARAEPFTAGPAGTGSSPPEGPR